MRVGFGFGGWVRVDDVDLGKSGVKLPGPVYARLRPTDRGRWRVTELYLDGRDEPITGEMLRRLPLAAIESFAQADGDDQMLARKDEKFAYIQMSVLASYYATTFGSQARHWVAQMWRSQFPGSGVTRVRVQQQSDSDDVYERQRQPVKPLRAPGGRLTDDFLHDVARAYAAAVERGDRRPAVTLAKQAGVTVSAVRKWVYTARKRSIMTPGLQGKAG